MAQNKETIKRGEEKLALLNRRYGIEYLQDIDVAIQNISDSVSREEWYSELLAGIDIGEIKRGNQTETNGKRRQLPSPVGFGLHLNCFLL